VLQIVTVSGSRTRALKGCSPPSARRRLRWLLAPFGAAATSVAARPLRRGGGCPPYHAAHYGLLWLTNG
jgi:hypothetical protein